ncbi:MAG: histidine--tRNA ligase [Leptospiraceae bacterium]|nr:histidine--tRNA ligase [Leptospiraceae bacterium]MCK6382378.1 histidine--tRNA ligase [Leptospiraceae bacterium]NUM41175.1 histidine--tRNA ligase [Leptospiraceae bacterium]
MTEKKSKLPTTGYKGTRDFYPDDMRLRNWMFSVMRETVKSFGYQEYDGPILESFDLYAAKTGEEIVQRQLYDFIDKGERRVAIRPEMTPTLARMVAAQNRNLPKPIRWFSIPNLWRYEAPGHGRLREHWQLNVDIFGVNSLKAEVEIIQLACEILYAFKAPPSSFKVKISHRKLLDDFLKNSLGLNESNRIALSKVLDKKNKISAEEFESLLKEILHKPDTQIQLVNKFLTSDIDEISSIEGLGKSILQDIGDLFLHLSNSGLSNQIEFDPSIVRGFDYYTGFIFEIFDTNPSNKRSLYGGGRYDNLIGLFSNEELSGIGFGLGDVTLENFLKVHNLIPDLKSECQVMLLLLDDNLYEEVYKLAVLLRKNKINCEMTLDGKAKIGKQISNAEKKGHKFILILGENEIQSGKVNLKNLFTGEESFIENEKLVSYLKEKLI